MFRAWKEHGMPRNMAEKKSSLRNLGNKQNTQWQKMCSMCLYVCVYNYVVKRKKQVITYNEKYQLILIYIRKIPENLYNKMKTIIVP